MNTLFLALLFFVFFTSSFEAHPRQLKTHVSNRTTNDIQVGQRRAVLSAIMTAFEVYTKLSDFMGSTGNIVGWFDNINRFMESGGTQNADQITTKNIDAVRDDIKNLAEEVDEGITKLQEQAENSQTLTAVSQEINALRVIDHLQTEYLEAAKRYKENPDKAAMRELRQKWFDDIDERFVKLQSSLILILEFFCDPIVANYNIFEGWAAQNARTATLVDLMNFVNKIRLLEANGFAVWKSHIYKKYGDRDARVTVELNSVERKMRRLTQCQNPAIANAFTKIIDYQGTPVYGRIRWSHTYENTTGQKETYDRCLQNSAPTQNIPYAQPCTSEPNQQWKLFPDNTLRPKDNPNYCLFLIETDEIKSASHGFKVFPCNSKYRSKDFRFEYLTTQIEGEPRLHTFFKLRAKGGMFVRESLRGQNICLAFKPEGIHTIFKGWVPTIFSCSCPLQPFSEIFDCISDHVVPTNEFGYFKFEPMSE